MRKAAPSQGRPSVSTSVRVCSPIIADFSAVFAFACFEIGAVYKHWCAGVGCDPALPESERWKQRVH